MQYSIFSARMEDDERHDWPEMIGIVPPKEVG